MKIIWCCAALIVIAIACGVKIAPSPFLADQPGRFQTESDRRAHAEAIKRTPTPQPAHSSLNKTSSPTSLSPLPTEAPTPQDDESLKIPPQ